MKAVAITGITLSNHESLDRVDVILLAKGHSKIKPLQRCQRSNTRLPSNDDGGMNNGSILSGGGRGCESEEFACSSLHFNR
jgi:hypothetical protein